MASSQAETAQGSLADVAARAAAQVATLDRELAEIDMLVAQARVEAERHDLKRTQAQEKLAELPEATPSDDVIAAHVQLVTLTRRASVMESQVEVLEGKRKTLARFRESVAGLASDLGVAVESGAELEDGAGDAAVGGGGAAIDTSSTGVTRIVMAAQEDLRRDIARAMHDGPAQSLTNIVLQAQIVDRLVARDPAMAQGEVRQLVAMVQQTLDATKSFIFDVRPMVLDDLGLVPTLRRSARDRGQRAGVAVEFESMGTDRRLPMELESGLFRIVDEALAAHIAGKPESLSLRMDWSDKLEIELTAGRTAPPVEASDLPADGAELPPALAEMVEERRAAHRAAVEEARVAGLARLPERIWREVSGRADTLGIQAELLDEGARLRLIVHLPEGAAAGLGQPATTATR